MTRLILALLLAALPATALAGATRGKQEMARIPYLFRDANCNPAGFCTWTLSRNQIAGNDIATFIVEADVTAVETPVMLCAAQYKPDSQTTVTGLLQTCDFALGVDNCVSTDTRWTKPLAVPGLLNFAWYWRVDVTALDGLTCNFRTTAPGPRWDIHAILSTY